MEKLRRDSGIFFLKPLANFTSGGIFFSFNEIITRVTGFQNSKFSRILHESNQFPHFTGFSVNPYTRQICSQHNLLEMLPIDWKLLVILIKLTVAILTFAFDRCNFYILYRQLVVNFNIRSAVDWYFSNIFHSSISNSSSSWQ